MFPSVYSVLFDQSHLSSKGKELLVSNYSDYFWYFSLNRDVQNPNILLWPSFQPSFFLRGKVNSLIFLNNFISPELKKYDLVNLLFTQKNIGNLVYNSVH